MSRFYAHLKVVGLSLITRLRVGGVIKPALDTDAINGATINDRTLNG